MEDIVQYAKNSGENWIVPYSEFIIEYKKDKDFIYFFCEGLEDKKYYKKAIENTPYSRDNIKAYHCNGKDKVIELEKQILAKKEYSKARLLFFVDRDFDDNTNISNNIYVTNYYSIENYYASINTFKEILKDEYNIRENTEDFNKAVDLFNETKERFHNGITLLNAFLACQADYRRVNKGNTRLNINKSLNKHFSGSYLESIVDKDFNINIHQDLNSIQILKNIFSEAPKIGDEKIEEKKNIFEGINKSEFFRGKLEIKFFISFLKRFKDKVTSKNDMFKQKYKCSIDVRENDYCTVLLGYVYTPNCLKNYIKRKI